MRPHDTLSSIAAAFGTTVPALMMANGLRDGDYIIPGQVLTLPDPAPMETGNTAAPCVTTDRRFRHDVDARGRWAHAGRPWQQWTCRAEQAFITPTRTVAPSPSAATLVTPAPTGVVVLITPTPTPTSQPGTGATNAPGAAMSSVAALLMAQAAGVDPALVKAVAWQESGWRMVTAADGGMGIMQLMPATVAGVETTLLGQPIDPNNPTDNVRAGVAVLRYYLTVFSNERLAIAAYHQGLASVRSQGTSAATAGYVANVLALQQQFAQ